MRNVRPTIRPDGKGIGLAIENILDANYSRVFGFPHPGRRLFFGITAKF